MTTVSRHLGGDPKTAPTEPRWRLRVFDSVQALVSGEHAVIDMNGFFTPESALRHVQTRLGAFVPLRVLVIMISKED